MFNIIPIIVVNIKYTNIRLSQIKYYLILIRNNKRIGGVHYYFNYNFPGSHVKELYKYNMLTQCFAAVLLNFTTNYVNIVCLLYYGGD